MSVYNCIYVKFCMCVTLPICWIKIYLNFFASEWDDIQFFSVCLIYTNIKRNENPVWRASLLKALKGKGRLLVNLSHLFFGFFSSKTTKMGYFIFKLKYLGVFSTWFLLSSSQDEKDSNSYKSMWGFCWYTFEDDYWMHTLQNFTYLIS